tara:strand:+ start:403 stop:1548 length:1146 start_codon:yes stop_codon:yes gene_type:complete
MACNCKNTITSFLGGDVANPTTFLNCGEADGTYNNPLETGKTQCVAEDNVLRILDEYYVSGTVKNAGQIVFERTVTGETVNEYFWQNDGTYFKPIAYTDSKLSAQTLHTSGNITAKGDLTVGTHDDTNFLYINRYNASLPYAHLYSDRLDNDVESGFRFLTRNSSGTAQEAFVIQGSDRKATFQGNVVISGTNTTLNTLSANTAINVGNGVGTVSAATFTGPSTLLGTSRDTGEIGVVTATTVVGKYSGVTVQNGGTDVSIAMTIGTFRPNMLIDVGMGGGTGDLSITLPTISTWDAGKYIFTFYGTPNAGGAFALIAGGSDKFYGMSICLDGNEIISNASRITFGAGKTIAGTKIEVIASEDQIQAIVYLTANKADVTPS